MRQSPARRASARVLVTMLVALATATALAELARLGWLPELASHFRPQYAAALVLLAAGALAMGRRRLALCALVVMVPNLWVAAPYLVPLVLPDTAASQPAGGLSLLSLNLFYRNTDHQRVRDYLQQAQPDLLVVAELTPDWLRALQPVLDTYPYQLATDQPGPWGLGVYSRFPMLNARRTDLGVPGSVNVMATVAFPGGPVQLTAVHLSSPTSPRAAARRNLQLARLAGLLGAQDSAIPRLLLGDLNATPFSPHLRDLLDRTGMRDARQAQGLLGTWPRWLPILQIPIDYCIVDPALVVTSVGRGPGVGSDHYPLEVRLRRRDEREITR